MGSSRLFPTGWIIVKPLVRKRAIGDPCALMRWQDHHNRCGGLFYCYYHIHARYMSVKGIHHAGDVCMTLEKNGKAVEVKQQEWHALNAQEVLDHLK